MSIQFFSFGRSRDVSIKLPSAYRQSSPWVPQIGDTFPDFTAPSTLGPISFHDWADGQWVYLFSHPAAFTSVCTTEMADVAVAAEDFAARGVKPMSISRDTEQEQQSWARDIDRLFDVQIDFPQVSDAHGVVSRACGMMHPKESVATTMRKSFIIDPSLKIRLMFDYPLRIGRSIDEVLRAIDALQMSDRMDIATPGNWQQGEDVLLMPTTTRAEAMQRYGFNWLHLTHYLRTVPSATDTSETKASAPVSD